MAEHNGRIDLLDSKINGECNLQRKRNVGYVPKQDHYSIESIIYIRYFPQLHQTYADKIERKWISKGLDQKFC